MEELNMRTAVEHLVDTVLEANDNAYPKPIGYDIASNVVGWVIVKLIHQEPIHDLVFVSEGWDEESYDAGFEDAKQELITYLENVLDTDIDLVNVNVSDTIDTVVKKELKKHHALYNISANEISKIVLGYLVGFFSFYKASSGSKDESYVAGKVKLSDNISGICREYIY